jgi:hypothetical protein
VLVRSRSLTRECEVLSGDEGGVPGLLLAGLRGARLGMVWLLDFFEDFVKREGRTMEAKSAGSVAACLVSQQRIVVGCSSFWLRVGTEQKS